MSGEKTALKPSTVADKFTSLGSAFHSRMVLEKNEWKYASLLICSWKNADSFLVCLSLGVRYVAASMSAKPFWILYRRQCLAT